jgi:hypothetical protein
VKSNWARLAPTLSYTHETATITVGEATVDTNHLVALGEVDVAGTALLGADPEDSPAGQLERAEELLADLLGDGERHRSKEIKAAAKGQGIPERTIKRAAHDAGVSMAAEGFPRVTWWSLPQSGQPLGPTDDGPTGPTGESPANTGVSDPAVSQSGQTPVDGPTGVEWCSCTRPRAAPDPENDRLVCMICGLEGWMG